MSELYYTAPSDAIFDEIKAAAIKVWHQYDESPGGYAQEKIKRIEDIGNVSDNAMYIVAMFDMNNQGALAALLSEEARRAVCDRMVAGGQPNFFNPFL